MLSGSTHCASSSGRLKSIQGGNPRTCCICCVTKGCPLAARPRSCVPLVRVPTIPRHCQARLLWCHERVHWRVEWHFVVISDESRFCLYANDGRTRRSGECHLPECICPQHTVPTSDFMVWGGGAISYNSRSHFVFVQGKVNSARYIAQVVNTVLLPFL